MAEAGACIPQHPIASTSSSSDGGCLSSNRQLQHKVSISLPILSFKKSTIFSSGLWSQNQTENAGDRFAEFKRNLADFHNIERLMTNDNVKISPVITPPPQVNKTTSIHIEGSDKSMRLTQAKRSGPSRLNKFVRRLHEMLLSEQSSGIVEWRKGLLVLHSTDAFTKKFLPKYFGTKNFKTFRRQLNYYGFVHVRSFSATGSTTTALWVNQDLAKHGSKSISSVLMLRRVEPSESSKTAEGRRVRKEEAVSTVEDIGIDTRNMELEQICSLATGQNENAVEFQEFAMESSNDNVDHPISPTNNVVSCQVSHNGTDSTSSSSSSSTKSPPPVPSSIDVTYPYSAVSSSDATTDDAANLLMMLSRSAV